MKISEFIEKLKAFQEEHGDLEVELSGEQGGPPNFSVRKSWSLHGDGRYLEIGVDD